MPAVSPPVLNVVLNTVPRADDDATCWPLQNNHPDGSELPAYGTMVPVGMIDIFCQSVPEYART